MKRVVVGRGEDRDSVVHNEEVLSWGDTLGAIRGIDLWLSHSSPPSLDVAHDSTGEGTSELEPPRGGSVFRIVEFAPKAESDVHATETLDYVVVVEGEIVLVVDGRELTLSAGDSAVQAGSVHQWVNRSDRPCLLAAVLLSGRRAENP